MPLVDGRVVLDARIGAGPGRVGDLVPHVLGRDLLRDLSVCPAPEVPVTASVENLEEAVGDADRVVRVLTGDREIGLAVPVGIVFGEHELGHTAGGELERLLDIGLGHEGRPRLAHGRPQPGVLLGIGLDALADAAGL